MKSKSPFTDIPRAIEEIRAGRMVVVVDDEDRENEGDLTIAAEKITPEAINFCATHGRGLICLAMTAERLDALDLKPMARNNTARFGTAFTESIDALVRGVTTGISASDRAETILCAIDPSTRPSDLGRPGHVFPLRAQNGGVLVRAGQTEAAVDLARLAGLTPAGVICEIMKDDGSMARVPDLVEFCDAHGLKMITVAELIRYRMRTEQHVTRKGCTVLRTGLGEFSTFIYGSDLGGESHLALVYGEVHTAENPLLVRVHAHCLAGDVFHTSLCDCAANLHTSLHRIAEQGAGIVIYLRPQSSGFAAGDADNLNRLQCRCEEETASLDAQRRMQREAAVSAQILRDLNIRSVRLLTDHSLRDAELANYAIRVVEHIPLSSAETFTFDLLEKEVLVSAN
jgi:3,4-dihydroxy 2-butanone 4-phosphate synthase/GTP cyclohydrolase II